MKPTYEELELRIQALEKIIQELKAENDKLKSQLGQNSKNSSKPSSSDTKSNIPPSINPSQRPYHPGAKRVLLPEQMVTSRETRVIETCPRCRSRMEPTGESSVWQQIELPPIKPLVHQIALLTCRCPSCHLVTMPQLSEKEALLLGPRLEGLVNLLMSQFRQGHRPVREFLATLIPGLGLSQGLISKIKQRAVRAFDHAMEHLSHELLTENGPKYIDATGWRHCGTNWHVLILRTGSLIRYAIVRRQNRVVLSALLKGGRHSVVSDRGLPIEKTSVRLHQYCLAHFLRNIRGAAEHASTTVEEAQTLGEIHETLQALFQDRHRHDRQELARSTYLQYGFHKWAVMRESFQELVVQASHPTLRRFCKRALSDWKKFMTYLASDGPMTNNLAEEALRNLVIARKLCFGSRSDYGREWREALHSCVETLRRQGKSVLDFVTDTIGAFRSGASPPKIA